MAGALTGLLLCAPDADAAGRPATARQAARPALEQSGPPEPLIAVVSIADQHIDVYGPGGSVTRSRVSTGVSGHDTPTGVFSILQRNRYHESNIYSNAPMPFMQRLTWSGIALHQGHVPNGRASHGCIRLPAGFAETLWGMGRIGMRVVVSPAPTAPQSIAHARLPRPTPAAATRTAALVQVATAGDAAAPPAERRLSPYDAAQERLARATAAKLATEKAIKPALELAAARSTEANRIAAAMKAAAGILADAEEDLELGQLAMSTVQTESAEAVIRERIKAAEAAVAAARESYEKLRQAESAASDEAFAAARAAREAQAAAEAAGEELSLARKATSPIAAFVSRKTGQVYVRQGFQVLHEGPIAIAEPDRPLGTHVYTAMQEADSGASLRWLAVSVPTSGGDPPRRGRNEPAAPVLSASSATAALERFELPDEVRELFSERLWPGASLIVSDFGLGETGQYTDFVILTK